MPGIRVQSQPTRSCRRQQNHRNVFAWGSGSLFGDFAEPPCVSDGKREDKMQSFR
jgi:hypothetical protein